MIALVQRVAEASVAVDGRVAGRIGTGVLALVGVRRADGPANAERLLERLLAYRVFPDADGRMNRSLAEAGGGLLLVPNFTLAADTRKGTRASFTPAAPPEAAEALFTRLLERARASHPDVQGGVFGAHMQVRMVGDGPVTFWIEG